jgi:hypothetical protein
VCVPAGTVVDVPVGAVVVVVVGGVDADEMNVPCKCQKPVKLLKGPPTMALAQVSVKAPDAASYVPVGAEVSPGVEPPGFGDPWLKSWLFQPTLIASRSPLNVPPEFDIEGTATPRPVWGSVLFVDNANFTPKNSCGSVIAFAKPFPLPSKAGEGFGW